MSESELGAVARPAAWEGDAPAAAGGLATATAKHDENLDAIIEHLLTSDPSAHHEVFQRLKMDWHATVEHGDVLATQASVPSKSS